MFCKLYRLLIIVPLVLVACQTANVSFTHTRAAKNSIPGNVNQIAILPYDYDSNTLDPRYSYLKNSVPDQIASMITSFGSYRVVERSRIETLMKERMIQVGDTVDEEEAHEVAQIAEAQAIVIGRISNVAVNDRRIMKQREVDTGDPDRPTRIERYPYLIRRITVGITSEMLNVENKSKIVTDSFRYVYNSEQDPNVTGKKGLLGASLSALNPEYAKNQEGRVPAVSDILERAAAKCARNFVQKISAHPIPFTISLKSGSSPGMENGLQWAQTQQYENAIASFHGATATEEAAAAWYNIGVCNEALKNFSEATAAYRQSDSLSPSSEAKEGIARIRRFAGSY